MRRTEQVQGLRLMKFEELYARTTSRLLSQAEAAEVLGVSERTFRRWRDRYEAEGAEGLYDRRLGRVSARRAPVDEVARVLALFDTRYWDFTAKHFHEKLVAEHGCARSYNWVRLTLQARGRMRGAPRRGAHRRKRPRRALPGMMVHQDGSRHAWVPGRWWDLIVTMDDATSTIYSAFFVDEEGTMSSLRALSEVIRERGLFCSLYADRASHYWHTPEAGGKVDKDNPTQVGRALMQLGIELIPAYSPEATHPPGRPTLPSLYMVLNDCCVALPSVNDWLPTCSTRPLGSADPFPESTQIWKCPVLSTNRPLIARVTPPWVKLLFESLPVSRSVFL